MATPTAVYVAPRQRKRLFQRARKRKTSFSDELRSAVDLYLELPPDWDLEAMTWRVKEINASHSPLAPATYLYAGIPVMCSPMISVWMLWVPS
jgi:hypothetical protein